MEVLLVILSVFCVAHFATGNEIEGIEHRILGGTPAKEGEFKYVVALLLTKANGRRVWCTGTVLDDYTVLTAGHCVDDSRSIQIFVNCVVIARCKKIRYGKGFIHSNYKRLRKVVVNDVGWVKPNQSINAQEFANLEQPLASYATCTVVGYGRTTKDGPERNRSLYKLQVTNVSQCSAYFPSNRRFTDKLCSCVQDNGQFYFGDSGGPLICDHKQVGVSSQFKGTFYNIKTKRKCALLIWAVPDTNVKWRNVSLAATHQSSLVMFVFMLLLINTSF